VAQFFVNTQDGRVALPRQLAAAGEVDARGRPLTPWFRIQGPSDASTMWYAVLRRPTRGIFIGALVLRHTPRLASLISAGWEEVPVDQIGAGLEPLTDDAPR
jgi:hypothetical protein